MIASTFTILKVLFNKYLGNFPGVTQVKHFFSINHEKYREKNR